MSIVSLENAELIAGRSLRKVDGDLVHWMGFSVDGGKWEPSTSTTHHSDIEPTYRFMPDEPGGEQHRFVPLQTPGSGQHRFVQQQAQMAGTTCA